MTDRDKIINGLESCSLAGTKDDCIGYGCPYLIYNDEVSDDCQEQMFDDALALLKAQEPRVMTLEEVLVWAEMPAEKRDPIFFEQRKGPNGWIANSACPKDYYIYCEDGDARCWTSRPTDEQRQAVKWE